MSQMHVISAQATRAYVVPALAGDGEPMGLVVLMPPEQLLAMRRKGAKMVLNVDGAMCVNTVLEHKRATEAMFERDAMVDAGGSVQ